MIHVHRPLCTVAHILVRFKSKFHFVQKILQKFSHKYLWDGWCRRYSDWIWAGRSADRIPVGIDFPHFQTSPGAHPASCTMGNGYFLGGKERPGRAADYSPTF